MSSSQAGEAGKEIESPFLLLRAWNRVNPVVSSAYLNRPLPCSSFHSEDCCLQSLVCSHLHTPPGARSQGGCCMLQSRGAVAL